MYLIDIWDSVRPLVSPYLSMIGFAFIVFKLIIRTLHFDEMDFFIGLGFGPGLE